MAIYDLFSKRKKREAKSGQVDVYQYDVIGQPLRVQIVHIWRDAMGVDTYNGGEASRRWKFIHNTIAREKGIFDLTRDRDFATSCVNWFLSATDTNDALDIIELTFRVFERIVDRLNDYERQSQCVKIRSKEAIEELNVRFTEWGVGYRYENGEIIRIDSQYVHAEIMKPALSLLKGKAFDAANEDFMAAHRHYRSGEVKDCIVACQRAFESTLKAICTLKKWPFDKSDRLPELLKVVRLKGLFPGYLDNGFDTYVAMLKTGLPGVRNNAGGHGAAPEAMPVPAYIAAYALHMTATNVVLAVDAYKKL